MVKNLTGGGKTKTISRAKILGIKNAKAAAFKMPGSMEFIGKVLKENGSGRFDIKILYEKSIITINAHASKKIRIKTDDYVLVILLRETGGKIQGEIIHKYTTDNIEECKVKNPELIKHLITQVDVVHFTNDDISFGEDTAAKCTPIIHGDELKKKDLDVMFSEIDIDDI
jgi:translation initiation factor IF-1